MLKGWVGPYAAVHRLVELYVCSRRVHPRMQFDKGKLRLLRELNGICKRGEGFLMSICEPMEDEELLRVGAVRAER